MHTRDVVLATVRAGQVATHWGVAGTSNAGHRHCSHAVRPALHVEQLGTAHSGGKIHVCQACKAGDEWLNL